MEVYVWFNGYDPEDVVIFLSKDEAINFSLKYPNAKIDVFTRGRLGHQMSYAYYINGVYYPPPS